MTPDVELAILGGGCAGLSLGLALSRRPQWRSRTVVLERSAGSARERTWCFWQDDPLPLASLVSRQWATLELRHGDRCVRVDCSDRPYQMIRGADFHAHAAQVLSGAPWLQHRYGEFASEVTRRSDGLWQVSTSSGALLARHVVDTRPPPQVGDGDAVLWQSFLGFELHGEIDRWDPGTVGLMEFLPGGGDDLRFLYVLPFSASHALVELTVFGPRRLDAAALEPALSAVVAELQRAQPLRILRREHGVLPMGLSSQHPGLAAGPARAGLMHGSARPSTGYAFQRIQRWAESCAQSLATGGGPLSATADPRWLQAMDRMFLQVLREHPARGADLFCALFAKVPLPQLLRFLGRGDRLRDALAVARALPASLFLPQLWPSAARRMGSP